MRPRGLPRRVIDQGGQRERMRMRDADRARQHEARELALQRITQAAGRIPVINSIEEAIELATPTKDLLTRSPMLAFPALQISSKLDIFKVFAALPQHYGNKPNVIAQRTEQPSVGPHFDHYYPNFLPWTVHENTRGTGQIRVTFLPRERFEAYNSLANSLPPNKQGDDLLAYNRQKLGEMTLAASRTVYEGELMPGTRTLLWQGDRFTPPSVHDFVRDEPGDYTIFARQLNGNPGVGFTKIK